MSAVSISEARNGAGDEEFIYAMLCTGTHFVAPNGTASRTSRLNRNDRI